VVKRHDFINLLRCRHWDYCQYRYYTNPCIPTSKRYRDEIFRKPFSEPFNIERFFLSLMM